MTGTLAAFASFMISPWLKTLAIIKEGQGQHFDPQVVDAFLAIEDEIKAELNFWKFMLAKPASEESELSNLFG
jgi:hypothetical protein